jgi:2,3,4,5-tetrahydropyridine-2-carboxylate N-succinyltransferase
MAVFALGLGIGTQNERGEWLEVFFPTPRGSVASDDKELAGLRALTGYKGGNAVLPITGSTRAKLAEVPGPAAAALAQAAPPARGGAVVAVILEADKELASVPEAYLKLHLLSHRVVRPHQVNLTGLFKVLPNVAWTSAGPVDPAELPALRLAARARGETLGVTAIDKFPALVDYVTPPGVRIADGARIRLGAWIGPGTTIMHEGFINFNAGTEGKSMVEGRISAGVVVGEGTDVGGGASTMGTLSGGGEVVISVGQRCLLGANAGLGISLGDDCTIEAGLYLTAGAKVRLLGRDGKPVRTAKARELSGRSNLLFRRNSQDGAIECLPNKAAISLNDDLHSHN